MKKIFFLSLTINFFIIYFLSFYITRQMINPLKFEPSYYDEYINIKKEYNLLDEYYDYIPAEAINNFVLNKANFLLVNKGFKDGVSEKSFVVNSSGLVGTIVKVFNNYSIVRKISSHNTIIPIEINNCYGSLKVKNGLFIIDDLINCKGVEISDTVFTSKYNYSSSNIPVGYVTKIKDDYIYINPYVNEYKIRFVGIINDTNFIK